MVRKPIYLVIIGCLLTFFLLIYLLKPDNFGKDLDIDEDVQLNEEGVYDDEFVTETGVIEDPSVVLDPLLEQTKTNQEIIDTRLEYYRQSKKELGVE